MLILEADPVDAKRTLLGAGENNTEVDEPSINCIRMLPRKSEIEMDQRERDV